MGEDLVVVIPGIMGSGLIDRRGRRIWGGVGGAVEALRTLGRSVKDLQLPPDIGDGPARDGVVASGLVGSFHAIPGIWTPVQGYSELMRFLARPRFGLVEDHEGEPDAPPGNLVSFAYDWRLSNRYSAERLKLRVETALDRWRRSKPERGDAKVLFVCHSMGGLVARWYLDRLGGEEVARALVTLGTPHRGAAKSVGQLVNGVRKGAWLLELDLTSLARSMPSAHQLLPEYACIDDGSGTLRKTTEVELPGLSRLVVADGMTFHQQLDAAGTPTYPVVPVVGIGQPTATTVEIVGDRAVTSPVIAGEDRGGDGTVPRLAARPLAMSELDAAIRGVGEGHGRLAAHRSVTDQLDFLLTAEETVFRGASPKESDTIGVAVDDLQTAGDVVPVQVHFGERRTLEVVAFDEARVSAGRATVRYDGQVDAFGRAVGHATLEGLAPGGYTIVVRAPDDPHGRTISPVGSTTLVLA